jgi:predicted MFS family arabinose efflux permease
MMPQAPPQRPSRAAAVSPAAWSALVVICLLGASNYMDRMVLAAVMPAIKVDLRLSDTQIGLLSLAFAIFYAVCGIPFGRYADARPRRSVIVLTATIWSLVTAATSWANSFVSLFLLRIGVAVGESGFGPAGASLIADYFPPAYRYSINGVMRAAYSVGVVAGLGLGGWLAATVGWRQTFVYLGLPGFLLAATALMVVREPVRGAMDRTQDASERPQKTLAALLTLWRNKIFRWITITSAFNAFCALGMVQWLPSFLHRAHGLDMGLIGLVFGAPFGLGLCAGQLAGGFWAARLARTHLYRPLILAVWVNLLSGLIFLLVLWSPNAVVAIVGTIVATFVSALVHAAEAAGTQNALPSSLQATGGAVSGLFTNLVGLGLGPLVVGVASDAVSRWAGDESLRWALSIAQILVLVAAYAGWRAYKTATHFVPASRGADQPTLPASVQ